MQSFALFSNCFIAFSLFVGRKRAEEEGGVEESWDLRAFPIVTCFPAALSLTLVLLSSRYTNLFAVLIWSFVRIIRTG